MIKKTAYTTLATSVSFNMQSLPHNTVDSPCGLNDIDVTLFNMFNIFGFMQHFYSYIKYLNFLSQNNQAQIRTLRL
jgi:hypothetical protein